MVLGSPSLRSVDSEGEARAQGRVLNLEDAKTYGSVRLGPLQMIGCCYRNPTIVVVRITLPDLAVPHDLPVFCAG